MRLALRMSAVTCVAAALAGGALVGAVPATAKVCDGLSVPCVIGDTGPGGGIVFYDAGSAQPWGRYLEAAPAGWFENPNSPPPATSPPGSVRGVTVTVRRGSAVVFWQAPSTGGSPETYRVLTDPPSNGCATAKRSCAVTGLTSGRSYAFTVVAVNAFGEGAVSKAVSRRIPSVSELPAPKPIPSYRVFPMVTPVDPFAQWCPVGAAGHSTDLPTGTDIGTGRGNTQIVVAACGRDTAAGLASAYYRGGDKDDWFLPSKDELNALYIQSPVVGDLARDTFWSSSQYDYGGGNAWSQAFYLGTQYLDSTSYEARVRPVRAF